MRRLQGTHVRLTNQQIKALDERAEKLRAAGITTTRAAQIREAVSVYLGTIAHGVEVAAPNAEA